MKQFFIPFILLIIPLIGLSQDNETANLKKNSIIVTPLGDLINDSKSSIYFRRLLTYDSTKSVSLRVGTELFTASNTKLESEEFKSSFWNIKIGLEIAKKMDRVTLYVGPELSYTDARATDVDISPGANAIFSRGSFHTEESFNPGEEEMSLTSLIGFGGIKYKLTKSIAVGIESAIGIGWFKNRNHRGSIRDLAANRFVSLEYGF